MKERNFELFSICLFIALNHGIVGKAQSPISFDDFEKFSGYIDTNKKVIEFDPNIFTFKYLMKDYEDDLTSGRCNRPQLLNEVPKPDSLKYGFYSVNFGPVMRKPPYMATVCVSFQKEPWRQDDPNQEVVVLVATEKEFENSPVNIRVGDSIDEFITSGDGFSTLENVIYKVFPNHILAIVVKDKRIAKYILWRHPSANADVKAIHEKIKKSYLKSI